MRKLEIPELNDKEWMQQKYIKEKLGFKEISNILGCSTQSVVRSAEKFNIPKFKNRGNSKFPELFDREYLYQKYVVEKLYFYDIAKKIGCTPAAVSKGVARCGLEGRKNWSAGRKINSRKRYIEKYPELWDSNWLYNKYIIENNEAIRISEILNVSVSAVTRALKRFDIPQRTMSEIKRGEFYREDKFLGQKHQHIKNSYGISIDDYEAMVQAQDNRCYICGKPETSIRKGRVLSLIIDHCHKTGKVRKLLCIHCNSAIGYVNDDVDLLQKCIKYIKEHKE